MGENQTQPHTQCVTHTHRDGELWVIVTLQCSGQRQIGTLSLTFIVHRKLPMCLRPVCAAWSRNNILVAVSATRQNPFSYTNTQIHKYTNTQIHKYRITIIQKST